MHGSVHDFVVLKTVPDSEGFPSGFGSGLINKVLKAIPSTKHKQIFEKVLDIGSLDICGSMAGYDYCGAGPKWLDQIGCKMHIGIDLIEGPNVDRIMNSHDMEFRDNYFDLVMCVSMIEHDTDPQKTVNEAYRVLKKGQPFILTTVDGNHPEHKHLGGGDTETYNFIDEVTMANWVGKAGFDMKNTEFYHVDCDLLIYAIK